MIAGPELRRIGRYTYVVGTGGTAAARLVLAEGPRAEEAWGRLARSAALRRLVDPATPLGRTLGGLHHEGPVEVDGQTVRGVAFDFLPGSDLTALARSGADGVAAVLSVAGELGGILADLHAVDAAALGVALPRSDAFGRHIRYWISRMAGMLRPVDPSVEVGGLAARSFTGLLDDLEAAVEELMATGFGSPFTPALLHNDAHGGNVLAAASPAGDWRVTGILDERLREGDGLFDVGALMDWALEIFDVAAYRDFCRRLLAGWAADGLATADARARATLYHVERSLGRLAYYFPLPEAERNVFPPVHVASLDRHVALLDRVVSGGHRWLEEVRPDV